MEIKKFKLESNIEIQYNHVCKLTVDIITAAIATTVEVSCVLLIKICTCWEYNYVEFINRSILIDWMLDLDANKLMTMK